MVTYDENIEASLSRLTALLSDSYDVSKRAIGLLLLQRDPR